MTIIQNSSYVVLKSTPDSHRVNLAEFYDIDGNMIYKENLKDIEWGMTIPQRILNMIDPKYVNKARPKKIILGPKINLNYINSIWLYIYDKNDNCIIHHTYQNEISNLDDLIKNKINDINSEGIDWKWVNENKEKVEFKNYKKMTSCIIL